MMRIIYWTRQKCELKTTETKQTRKTGQLVKSTVLLKTRLKIMINLINLSFFHKVVFIWRAGIYTIVYFNITILQYT